ncbi:MAG TPA: endo-1,4-beta-xylanase, partial [Gemmataceae bacterium]|nr:endo-1,4-beta-xylanase [Gemmataceae bacterium]
MPAGLPEATAEDLLRSAVGGGHDRCPTPTRCHLRADQLTLNREVNESGPCYVPWDVPRAGRLMTPTTSLMVRDRQYQLGAELARGKINQVRNQYGEWEGGGLDPAPDVEALLTRATKSLAEAVLSPPGPASDRPADAALADAFEAADLLVRKYVDQVFRLRHQRQPRFDTAFGCRLTAPPVRGLDDAFRLSFNAACVPLTWRLIEPTESGYQWEQADAAIAWAADRNLPVYAGPLIDFSDAGFPDYVLNGDGDPITLKSLISDYVGTVAARYRGKVSRWLISSGANGSSVLGMSEEDLVRLTVMAADAAWQIDPNMQIVFGLSQP